MDLLKYRWIKSKNGEKELSKISESIILEQIYLILFIFSGEFLIFHNTCIWKLDISLQKLIKYFINYKKIMSKNL